MKQFYKLTEMVNESMLKFCLTYNIYKKLLKDKKVVFEVPIQYSEPIGLPIVLSGKSIEPSLEKFLSVSNTDTKNVYKDANAFAVLLPKFGYNVDSKITVQFYKIPKKYFL